MPPVIEDDPNEVAFRPRRVLLPPSEHSSSYLLEVFELGTGPIGTGARHAVWLHRLKAGGYRWACSCGTGMAHHELDAALLGEARAHFDQVWEPVPSPIWHPVAVWTDRAHGARPPSAEDLAKLAHELSTEMT